jgi:hypothetical protein
MLLSHLETSSGQHFNHETLVDYALVRLNGDCEQGQTFDYGIRLLLDDLLSWHASIHRSVHAVNSTCHRLLFDGNIRCCSWFADKAKVQAGWAILSEGSGRGQMQVLQCVES